MFRLLISGITLMFLIFPSPVLTQDKSSPTERKKQQDESSRKGTNSKPPQARPAEGPHTVEVPATVLSQESTGDQEKNPQQQAQSVWDKFAQDSKWIDLGMLILAGFAVWFSYTAYWASTRQADAAEGQLELAKAEFKLATKARLYVDSVRVADFKSGFEPIFFVRIVNAGPVAAEDVAVNIRVESQVGGAKYTNVENPITIPANGSRDYFIGWPAVLDDTTIDGFERQRWPLCVTGYFEYQQKRTEYCYKYHPASEPRTERLPQFIPCDFDTRRTVLLSVGGTIGPTGKLSPEKAS